MGELIKELRTITESADQAVIPGKFIVVYNCEGVNSDLVTVKGWRGVNLKKAQLTPLIKPVATALKRKEDEVKEVFEEYFMDADGNGQGHFNIFDVSRVKDDFQRWRLLGQIEASDESVGYQVVPYFNGLTLKNILEICKTAGVFESY